ncbi:MAG: mechanosensitive ion channel family protein [Patescibacteria group bacterium UBA2163]
MDILNLLFFQYGVATAIFIGTWIVLWTAKKFVINRLEYFTKKTNTDLDDAAVGILNTINPVVLGAASLAFSIRFADVPEIVVTVISAVFMAALIYQLSVGIARILTIVIVKSGGSPDDVGRKAAASFLAGGVKVIIWLLGALWILSNFGVNVTSLIAGLGIGGVAIAFALQKILSDLFSSFAIYLDKPFEVGDFIIVGGNAGTVEKIGIKTTRLRALQGEELVISNAELTTSRVQNFKKMEERRVQFRFGVLYETPHALLKEIPGMIKKIVEAHDDVRLDRAHLAAYSDSAVTFELVYFVLSGDYKKHMDINEEILFSIKEAFDKKGIGFAYPTQTLYVKKDALAKEK